MWGALSDEKLGSVVLICCWASPVQSFWGVIPMGLMNIFYCVYFWDSPNLEGQVPVFISPRNRVAQLYPRALGSTFVALYSQEFSLLHDVQTNSVAHPASYTMGTGDSFRNGNLCAKYHLI
jgi:hypothetical protein